MVSFGKNLHLQLSKTTGSSLIYKVFVSDELADRDNLIRCRHNLHVNNPPRGRLYTYYCCHHVRSNMSFALCVCSLSFTGNPQPPQMHFSNGHNHMSKSLRLFPKWYCTTLHKKGRMHVGIAVRMCVPRLHRPRRPPCGHGWYGVRSLC